MNIKKQAEQGIITDNIYAAAKKECLDAEFIRKGICDGSIVIPCNKNRKIEKVCAIGQGTSTKINANIGASPYHSNPEEELQKLEAAVKYGADAVMDLSLGPEQIKIRREVIAHSPVPVGTVPIYQTGFELSSSGRNIEDMTINDFFNTIRNQAEEGVDFMTIHSGVTREVLAKMENQGRALDVVSRGGSFLISWMRRNGKESPLYEYYDEILDILAEYDVTISLGDGLRPGSTVDATDRAQISELIVLGELTERAWAKGVQAVIEGPGHVPLNQVAENMQLQKSICSGAPFYILGPLVTDIASGYDHIAGAIGGAVAAINGADFLCYLTPAEHLKLPTVNDVIDGVIASKIAAHAADLVKNVPGAWERERAMAKARKTLDWEKQIELSVNPDKARAYRQESEIGEDNVCTMCGEFCAIKRLQN
ncbi:MAG: phosphomethylpyrimidine synthase ThiC [Spirochaetes bacterium]|nr:phosphomethylpyrimidine synthase ThiC [Spirochaetota bacterium]